MISSSSDVFIQKCKETTQQGEGVIPGASQAAARLDVGVAYFVAAQYRTVFKGSFTNDVRAQNQGEERVSKQTR